jgi:hypothetical protein
MHGCTCRGLGVLANQVFFRDIRNLVGFVADETEQRRSARPADFGQVHDLQSVAVGAQR